MTTRRFALPATLAVLAAIGQLMALRWGFPGEIAGGLLCGGIVLVGWRVFAPDIEPIYLLPLMGVAASLLGLCLGIAGSTVAYRPAIWTIPIVAALPTGVPALWVRMRDAKCDLCRGSLRSVLSFSCPRCDLIACENCWEFERGRCHLCAANQVGLFPVDSSWWEKHFGTQVYSGRCALCLRTADWRVSHWGCTACGHAQCRLCWDENNGLCSRCGWTVATLSAPVNSDATADRRQESRQSRSFSKGQEVSRAQIPNAVRHGSSRKEIQR